METVLIIIVFLILYLLGCILAYGRAFAMFYNIDKEYVHVIEPSDIESDNSLLAISIFSWIGFLAGTVMFFIQEPDDKYFLKYNNDDLWEIYNKNKDRWKIN